MIDNNYSFYAFGNLMKYDLKNNKDYLEEKSFTSNNKPVRFKKTLKICALFAFAGFISFCWITTPNTTKIVKNTGNGFGEHHLKYRTDV